MTLTLTRPEATLTTTIPDTYKLLSVFGTQPLDYIQAFRRAGLATQGEPITDYARGVLRLIRAWGWVSWNGHLNGYTLTGIGEVQLERYHRDYGPALTPHTAPAPEAELS